MIHEDGNVVWQIRLFGTAMIVGVNFMQNYARIWASLHYFPKKIILFTFFKFWEEKRKINANPGTVKNIYNFLYKNTSYDIFVHYIRIYNVYNVKYNATMVISYFVNYLKNGLWL